MQSDPTKTAVIADRGRIRAYVFALIVSVFLGYQCHTADRRGESVDPIVWMPCLLLIGTAVGVSIPSELLGQIGNK